MYYICLFLALQFGNILSQFPLKNNLQNGLNSIYYMGFHVKVILITDS